MRTSKALLLGLKFKDGTEDLGKTNQTNLLSFSLRTWLCIVITIVPSYSKVSYEVELSAHPPRNSVKDFLWAEFSHVTKF